MNRFKFSAYMAEFPALQALLVDRNEQPRSPQYCDSIKIARVSVELLNTKPSWTSHDDSMVSISKKETVSFLLEAGILIKDAVRQEATHGSNYAHSSTKQVEGETLLEAIHRLNCADTLKLVFWVRAGFVVREHCSEPNYNVCIYKPAQGISIPALITEAEQSARAEVRAEANF